MVDERFSNWEIDVEKGVVFSTAYNKNRELKGRDINGYVILFDGKKHILLHRLIWMVANQCEIPNGYHIHHVDGNKQNNSIYNLELVETFLHNSEHKKGNKNMLGKMMSEETKEKLRNKLINRKDVSIKVAQYALNGELVKIWESINECGRNGFDNSTIVKCCKGKKKTHKGFKWEYYNEEKDVA